MDNYSIANDELSLDSNISPSTKNDNNFNDDSTLQKFKSIDTESFLGISNNYTIDSELDSQILNPSLDENRSISLQNENDDDLIKSTRPSSTSPSRRTSTSSSTLKNDSPTRKNERNNSSISSSRVNLRGGSRENSTSPIPSRSHSRASTRDYPKKKMILSNLNEKNPRSRYGKAKFDGSLPKHLLTNRYFSADNMINNHSFEKTNHEIKYYCKPKINKHGDNINKNHSFYYEDRGRHEFVYDPRHLTGEVVTNYDLRPWLNISETLTMLEENNISLEHLNISKHNEVNIMFIKKLCYSNLFQNSLLTLDISGCNNLFPNDALVSLGKSDTIEFLIKLNSLNSLIISDMEHLLDCNIITLISNIKTLKSIDISTCKKLTDVSLQQIAMYMKNSLTSIAANNNTNFTLNGMNDVLFLCESLEYIDMRNCPNIKFSGVVVRTHDGTLQYISRSLKSMNIDGCKGLDMTSMTWWCSANSELAHVSMMDIPIINNSIVQSFSSIYLKSLNISKCKQVDSKAIRFLGLGINFEGSGLGLGLDRLSPVPNLTELNIARIGTVNSDALTKLLANCKSLTSLDITANKGISDKAFSDLIIDDDTMNILSANSIDSNSNSYGNSTSKILLRKLILTKCTGLTSFGIACMAERCTDLISLNISSIDNVTDAALIVIAGCCSELREFRADDCSKITDRGVIEIITCCIQLEILNLSSTKRTIDAWETRFTQFTDQTMIALFSFSKNMKEITFRNQYDIKLADPWFKSYFIAKGGHNKIRLIDFRGVDKLNLKSAQKVFRYCTSLTDVYLPDNEALPGVTDSEFLLDCFKTNPYCFIYNEPYDNSLIVGPSTEGNIGEMRDDITVLSGVTAETSATVMLKKMKKKADYGTKVTNKDKGKGLNFGNAVHVCKRDDSYEGGLALRIRDDYYRRKMVENMSARIISFKYRLYRLWMRIRIRISATKISMTYYNVLTYRRFMLSVKNFKENLCAKKIQRQFRHVMLPLIRAACIIQKSFRRYRWTKVMKIILRRKFAAIYIQKIARGMIVRVSDMFILSQLFLKLPPFWRAVLNSCPPQENKLRNAARDRNRTQSYQIQDSKDEAVVMMDHILSTVARDGVLQPKLPFLVPQPFDKTPYVSLNDGRKMTFYSSRSSLLHSDTRRSELKHKIKKKKDEKSKRAKLSPVKSNELVKVNKEDEEIEEDEEDEEEGYKMKGVSTENEEDKHRQPVHIFNITFWPLTEPPQEKDLETSQHDPYLNGFDVAQNSKVALFCEVCHTRLRVVNCKTCQRGYCFYCAFRFHTNSSRRSHSMEIMEPRIVKVKDVSKTLIYHIDMAKKASYDLGSLVKYMKSSSEVKRINDEKKAAKEFEAQEEARRIAFLKAQDEDEDKHIAVTKIACIVRRYKAKKLVNDKRDQIRLEEAAFDMADLELSCIPFQKLFRQASTREWFSQRGVKYKLNRVRPKKRRLKQEGEEDTINQTDLRARINYEIRQRRLQSRKKVFHNLIQKYAKTMQMLDCNIEYWLAIDGTLPPEIEFLQGMRVDYYKEHEEQSQETAAQKPLVTPYEYEKLEKELKRLLIRAEACDAKIENNKNLRWWIAQHMRSAYRRKAVLQIRIADCYSRLEWVSLEAALLGRIEMQMQFRIDKLSEINSMKIIVDWLTKHLDYAQIHSASLDAQQETILLEECNRLDRDYSAGLEYDSLLQELYNGIMADCQYIGEKTGLEMRSQRVVPGTEEAVLISEQLLLIKRKQNQLADSVLDTIKQGLQTKLNAEEDANVNYYGFPTDEPDLKIEEMHKITAVLLEPFVPSNHCKISDFLIVYMSQPWIGELAVDDVRFEEIIRSKELEIDKLQAEIKGVKNKIFDAEKKIKKLKKQIEELTKEIGYRTNMTDEELNMEDMDQKETRMEEITLFTTENFKKDSEILMQKGTIDELIKNEAPMQAALQVIMDDVAALEHKLQIRSAERSHMAGFFFDKEEILLEELFQQVAQETANMDKLAYAKTAELRINEGGLALKFIKEHIETDELTLEQRNALKIPKGCVQWRNQDCLAKVRERTDAPAEKLIYLIIDLQRKSCEADLNFINSLKEALEQEEKEIEEFNNQRPIYEKNVELFQAGLLYLRRQRALQREIEDRKKRLKDLRETRMRQQKEAQDLAISLIKEKEAVRKLIESKKIPLSKQLAIKTKKFIRGTKDAYRNFIHNASNSFTPEEQQISQLLKEKSKAGAGDKVSGIRKLYITEGVEDATIFKEQNDVLESKGLPYYVKMTTSIGDGLFLWFQFSMNGNDFITNLEFGHKDKNNPLYKDEFDMEKAKFEPVTHPKTKLIFWIKRDLQKIKAFGDLRVCMSEQDETRCIVDGFEKIETSLEGFDLPDIYIWKKTVEKISDGNVATNVNVLLNEVIKSRAMLAKKPDDRNLQIRMEKLNKDLEKSHKKYQGFEVTNPLLNTVEYLALNKDDLEKWLSIFEKFDLQKEGFTNIDDFFIIIEETPTILFKDIFINMDAINEDGKIEFGDFIRACSTFCMFGKTEILQWLFHFADRETKEGKITHEQFVALLNLLHPYDKRGAKRALKELNMIKGQVMKFPEFELLAAQFPTMFYPAFRFQHHIRLKCLGEDWWVEKLRRYAGVRKKMAAAGAQTDLIAELEMQRFEEDQARAKRMVIRAQEIKHEPSGIRKVILNARQILDEFS